MAEYRMLPTETPSGLLDYSGNGRNATGTVGTAPTIIATTGGLNFTGNGAVSLPASLNTAVTIQLILSYNALSNTQTDNSPIGGNAGTNTSSALTFTVNGTNPGVSNPFAYIHSACAAGYRYTDLEFFEQTNLLTWVLGASDNVYIAQTPLASSGSGCVGQQTAGNYQLGGTGANGVVFPSFYTGNIYYAVFYNRALTATEVAANYQYLYQAMANRGLILGTSTLPVTTVDGLTIFGDSISFGFGVSNPWPYSLTSLFGTQIYNESVSGKRAAASPLTASPAVSPLTDISFQPVTGRQMFIEWLGTNDVCGGGATAAATHSEIAANLTARRKEGYKTGVATMVSRTGCDAVKNSLNVLIRQNWNQYADALIDIAADPNLGADGASANATFFQGDAIHPTQISVYNLIDSMMNRAIARVYGAHDFSQGSVYASAAAVATATTSGSESGNVVTLVFGSNPFSVGNVIVCTGFTPAGYNSPAGFGWYVTATNATNAVFTNTVSGLGAVTVQGSCSTPQQADGDQYYTLNFGAGNHTLNTCRGFTGQDLYIKNINAGASTVVPFGSELIDGAASVSVASKATLILQSILTSASAAGCSWKQLQNN
jgi:hypothetical protein